MKQAQSLPPFCESHFGFLKEQPLNRPFASAAVLAKLYQRPRIVRIRPQRLHHPLRPRIVGVRQLQGNGTNCLQLIDEHLDNAPLAGRLLA
jgi:hypothetical protein